jgi:hypothetical protein
MASTTASTSKSVVTLEPLNAEEEMEDGNTSSEATDDEERRDAKVDKQIETTDESEPIAP